MNKKMLSVLIILLSLMISACGGEKDEPEVVINKVAPEEISESPEAEEKVEKEEPEEKEPEKKEPEEKAEDVDASGGDGAEMMPAVDDQVIYDEKGIKITLHPLYRYDSKTKEGEDISGEPDMKFSGNWNDQGDYTATGDGTIDMVIFEADGEQYSVGGFTAPSGEKAAVAINR